MAVYQPRGTQPIPRRSWRCSLLQAYDQVGDAEAVVTAGVNRRWQLALGCLGTDRAPFSQGALVAFRKRLIAHDLDKTLLDKAVALAKARGGFGWQHLRAALDSSPLPGAGRIEDAWNLIGRAMGTVVTCAARTLRLPRAQVLRAAGITLLGAPSLDAALDIDWQDPAAQTDALTRFLAEGDPLERWVGAHVPVADRPCRAGGGRDDTASADARPRAGSHHRPAADPARRRRRSDALGRRSRDAAWAQDQALPRSQASNDT